MASFWVAFAAVNIAIYAAALYLIETRIARRDPLRFSSEAAG